MDKIEILVDKTVRMIRVVNVLLGEKEFYVAVCPGSPTRAGRRFKRGNNEICRDLKPNTDLWFALIEIASLRITLSVGGLTV